MGQAAIEVRQKIARHASIELDRRAHRDARVVTLLEVDVTRARRALRHSSRNARVPLSLVSWIAKRVVADAPHPATVTLMIERTVDGDGVTVPFRIDRAAERTVADIEREIGRIRASQVGSTDLLRELRPGPGGLTRAAFLRALPSALRRRIARRIVQRAADRACHAALSRTFVVDRVSGSRMRHVIITASGMGGRIRGWFIPRAIGAPCIGIGAVANQGVVLNGRIEPRQILSLTVVANRRAINPGDASRWIGSLVRGMERGADLPAGLPVDAPVCAPR